MTENKEYKAESIKVLEGLEGVRKRPSMYIGSTGKDGLHHLVYEVVDNSIDEAMAGYCDTIVISINKDGSVTVNDNGRGIPVEKHPVYKKSAMEIALTKLHAGGKFDKDAYMISGGLHGVGVSCVNALSIKMIAKVKRDGNIYQQEYKIGVPLYDVKVVGKADKKETGTEIIFYPDPEIFSTLEFDFVVLRKRIQEVAFLNPNVTIVLKDDKKGKEETFHYSGGLTEFVSYINKSKPILHKPIYFRKQTDSTIVEVAIQYTDSYNENIFGFVNTINTTEGGTHISGFKTALTRAINDYAIKKGVLKNEKLMGDDTREGLTAIINLKMKEPQFEGQTKTKLGNSEMKGVVDSMVYIALTEFLEENPTISNKICQKIVASAKAREAARKARDLVRRKNAMGGLSGLPGKLLDCSSKKIEKTELYIVEGDSAAGSGQMARDKEYQAILPLKGKILNVEKSNPTKALSSDEIVNLITAIGTGIKENFDITKLRYGKIIVMSVDGEEGTFVENPNGMISFVKIGNFIDKIIEKEIDPGKFKVLCFGLKSGKTQFKNIKTVIKHPIEEKLYEIKTTYGRNVKITSSHSIFVYENGELKLKLGSKVKKDDVIVATKNLPLQNYNPIKRIDALSLLVKNKDKIKNDIYVHGKSVEILIKARIKEKNSLNRDLIDERVIIPAFYGKILGRIRKEKSLSQKTICDKIGIKQPCVYYEWEKGKSKPSLPNFKKYLDVLGIDSTEGLKQVQIVKSRIDNLWENHYRNSGRNKLKDYIKIRDLELEDLKYLDSDVTLCPVHYNQIGIKRYIPIDENFAMLAGFWTAEGSLSWRNGIRLSIGSNDNFLLERLNQAFYKLFNLRGKLCAFNNRCSELKLLNTAAVSVWKCIFGLTEHSSMTKKIPDIIFNLNKNLQMEFLRYYFLGDGTILKNGISFTTVSKDLANNIMYLLQSFGVVSGVNIRNPSINEKIVSKNIVYTVHITNKEDVLKIKKIWEEHRNSCKLNDYLNNGHKGNKSNYEKISEDLIGLKVKEIKEVESSNGDVYDFSVDEDENFIAGFGGLCCHNTDADVDGSHIRTLLLTFFYRYMPELIENGNVFVAVSPLFRVRKGKDFYVHSEEELKKVLEKLGGKADVQRFKGLGEMNADQLWDTTMDPKKRILKKINIEDAVLADETFSMLMGDVVGPRRKFIETNANIAEVDI